MIKEFIERVSHGGYTYDELCIAAGGGGKGNVAPEAAPAMQTTTNVGEMEDPVEKTFEGDSIDTEKAIDKKKMGTRGLQIPLAADKSTTSDTASTTGVQI